MSQNDPTNQALVHKAKYSSFDGNHLNFKIQNGPIKEVGENGNQIDDLIIFCRDFIAAANKRFPCRENSLVITKLEESCLWLKARKEERLKRGVEGYNKD